MKFTILGQGEAVPDRSLSQEDAVQYALANGAFNEEQQRVLPALYRMSGVKRRHTVLLDGYESNGTYKTLFPPSEGIDDKGPTIRERMLKYEEQSPLLAVGSSREALAAADTLPEAITHLVTVSCSGFAAPGVDISLIRELGLRQTVQRVHVGFMGCHGALNGVRVARSIAESNPKARVLLCAVEVCSLHYHYGWDPEKVVANALFADGSAAIVGAAGGGEEAGQWAVKDTGSCLIPDSEDAMSWCVRTHGFEMSLSPRVPDLICTHLRGWMEGWLGDNGLALSDIKSWAIHPGGPRILSSAAKALDLPKDALDISKGVLRDYGNMSSPTILFIVKRLRDSGAELPCVALAFGPGLMAEAVLFA